MDSNLEKKLQESEAEWADIERLKAAREKKDQKILSIYCAMNRPADIIHTIELLAKYNGLPQHDKEIVENFKNSYPDKITVKLLHAFLDTKDIYKEYLESGGSCDE